MLSRPKTYLIALSFLVIGASIYAFFRVNIIFFDYFGDPFISIKILLKDTFLYNIFRYSLPDALWYGALLLIQNNIASKHIISKFLFYISVCLPFLLEILQYYRVIPGTFDIVDIIIYLLTLILFLCLRKKL